MAGGRRPYQRRFKHVPAVKRPEVRTPQRFVLPAGFRPPIALPPMRKRPLQLSQGITWQDFISPTGGFKLPIDPIQFEMGRETQRTILIGVGLIALTSIGTAIIISRATK